MGCAGGGQGHSQNVVVVYEVHEVEYDQFNEKNSPLVSADVYSFLLFACGWHILAVPERPQNSRLNKRISSQC